MRMGLPRYRSTPFMSGMIKINKAVYCTFGMMYVQEGSPSDMHC
jgi:hypothetical protein